MQMKLEQLFKSKNLSKHKNKIKAIQKLQAAMQRNQPEAKNINKDIKDMIREKERRRNKC